jgi:hypothetical protein
MPFDGGEAGLPAGAGSDKTQGEQPPAPLKPQRTTAGPPAVVRLRWLPELPGGGLRARGKPSPAGADVVHGELQWPFGP